MANVACGNLSRNPVTNISAPLTALEARSEAQSTGPEPLPALGLSLCSQSFREAVTVKKFRDGSATVHLGRPAAPRQRRNEAHNANQSLLNQADQAKKDEEDERTKSLQQAYQDHLIDNAGKRKSAGLTFAAVTKVKRAARLIAHECKVAAFVTLTFGQYVPDHALSKRILSRWLRRLERKYGRYPLVWVAELQDRGAIHFHLIIGGWVDKAWLNDSWNAVVNAEAIKQKQMPQRLYPNVKGGKDGKRDYISKTLACYMAKVDAAKRKEDGQDITSCLIEGNTYNINQPARTLMRPEIVVYEFDDVKDALDAIDGSLDAAEGKAFSLSTGMSIGFTWDADTLREALATYASFLPDKKPVFSTKFVEI